MALLEWALNLMQPTRKARSVCPRARKARGDGTSKSAVSRRFVALSRKKMKAWLDLADHLGTPDLETVCMSAAAITVRTAVFAAALLIWAQPATADDPDLSRRHAGPWLSFDPALPTSTRSAR